MFTCRACTYSCRITPRLPFSVCWRPWLSAVMESVNIHSIHIWWANVSLPLRTTGGSCNQHLHTLWIIVYPDNGYVCASTEKKGCCFFLLLSMIKRELWLGNSMTDVLSVLLFGLFRLFPNLSTVISPHHRGKSLCHLQDNQTRINLSTKNMACCHLTVLMMRHNNWWSVCYALGSHTRLSGGAVSWLHRAAVCSLAESPCKP